MRDLIKSVNDSTFNNIEDLTNQTDKDESPLGIIKSNIVANAEYASSAKLEDDSTNLGQK